MLFTTVGRWPCGVHMSDQLTPVSLPDGYPYKQDRTRVLRQLDAIAAMYGFEFVPETGVGDPAVIAAFERIYRGLCALDDYRNWASEP